MTGLQDQPKLKAAQRPRTAARVAAVQALFQIEQNGDRSDSVIEQFLVHRFGTTLSGESYEDGRIPEADVALFTSIVTGAVSNRTSIESDIIKTLPSTWPIERLDPVLRALFFAAIAEARHAEVPAAVLINEYMDVAHGFFFGDEPRLVNGVLDTLFKNPTPVEDDDNTTGTPAED